jgi:hypothetical protein
MAWESAGWKVCLTLYVAICTLTKYIGVFRISCEVTLQLLRDNKDSLMSVLDAFVHDPLVEWEDEKRKLVCNSIFLFMQRGGLSLSFLGPRHFTKRPQRERRLLQKQGRHSGTCEICAKSNREKTQGDILAEEFPQ